MELSEYAEVGTWHWSELYETLPIYEIAYSYFQKESETQYNAIVDSGRGFLISDLLDWVNIYTDDIYNLQFYVNDHHGIQAAFDYDSLFSERYYFNDLPGHREIIRDKLTWAVTGYDFEDAWSDCEQVEPMLAIEDNWATFTQEVEHIAPDFEQANPMNRFRLLFGQTEPTEQLTSKSAKYVSCIYVTLYGQPVYHDPSKPREPLELNMDLGSHSVRMTVSVDNPYLLASLPEQLNLTSSDENVIQITGWDYEFDEDYSDLAYVTIYYETVGEGPVTINTGFGSISAPEGEEAFRPITEEDLLPKDEDPPEEDPPEEDPPEEDPPEEDPPEEDPPENEDPGNVVPDGGDENKTGNDDPANESEDDPENGSPDTLPEDS